MNANERYIFSLESQLEKEKLNTKELDRENKILKEALVKLHTAAWTGNTEKIKDMMARIGEYAHSLTDNEHGSDEHIKFKLNNLIK